MQKIPASIVFGLAFVMACNTDPKATGPDNTDNQDTLAYQTTGTDTIAGDTKPVSYATIGEIVKLDEELNNYLAADTEIEILAEGFTWSEGPVWVDNGGFVLFSDVPENKIYKWKEGEGISVYLEPSGYSGTGNYSSEPGSNGLMLDAEGKLLLCQHGNRQVARMASSTDYPNPDFQTIADNYEGKRLNSPNDLAIHSDGDIYFTDPPYGLPGRENSTEAELDFYGVFRVDPEGDISLLTDQLTRPNGIAFSPDYSLCYVNVSDGLNPVTMAYPVEANGSFGEGHVFFDAKPLANSGQGLPDGLCVHPSGTLFSTGPGGILIINPAGKHLGTIRTTQATANCTFDSDYAHLYITADRYLLRVGLIN